MYALSLADSLPPDVGLLFPPFFPFPFLLFFFIPHDAAFLLPAFMRLMNAAFLAPLSFGILLQ